MNMNKIKSMYDDFTEDEYGVWTQVCERHAEELPYKGLSDWGEGNGICGRVGCWEDSLYYYDFE